MDGRDEVYGRLRHDSPLDLQALKALLCSVGPQAFVLPGRQADASPLKNPFCRATYRFEDMHPRELKEDAQAHEDPDHAEQGQANGPDHPIESTAQQVAKCTTRKIEEINVREDEPLRLEAGARCE